SYLVADVTRLSFNISYQIGYGIGRGKPLLLTKNTAIEGKDQLPREVGLFGPLRHKQYQTARQLAGALVSHGEAARVVVPTGQINQKAPVYVLLPKTKTELEVHLISRVKKARLFFRTFDPEEEGMLSVYEAVKNVAASYGIIVPLLPTTRKEA